MDEEERQGGEGKLEEVGGSGPSQAGRGSQAPHRTTDQLCRWWGEERGLQRPEDRRKRTEAETKA